ncbi:MAG TPA: molybdenum cofactor guanylyltransferase [Methanobacterium sp.]
MKSFIVLCGGKSTRMGQDKGSFSIDGKPMIIHVLETLALIADDIVIVLRDENQVDDYKQLFDSLTSNNKTKLKICTDILKDQGPLAGILTGLEYIKSDKAMVIPCDSPFVTEFFVNKMFTFSEEADFDAFVPKWSNGKLEPLHSIYNKDLQPVIQKLLYKHKRDVKSFIDKLKVEYIDAESLDGTGRSFININRADDVSEFK